MALQICPPSHSLRQTRCVLFLSTTTYNHDNWVLCLVGSCSCCKCSIGRPLRFSSCTVVQCNCECGFALQESLQSRTRVSRGSLLAARPHPAGEPHRDVHPRCTMCALRFGGQVLLSPGARSGSALLLFSDSN
jgi:hypothetical protein